MHIFDIEKYRSANQKDKFICKEINLPTYSMKIVVRNVYNFYFF